MLGVSGILVQLIGDTLRWWWLTCRSTQSIKAENLCLRRQLALYVERGIKPRRIDPVTRISLAILSRFFNWRDALVVRVFPIRRPRVALTKSPVRAIATGSYMQSVPRRIASRMLPRALLCVTEFLRTTMCLARIACTLWQSAFAPTVAAAARSVTEMRLGKFTRPIVGSITGALTGVMTFTAALCLVASDIRALMASAGGGRRNDFHEARVWQRGVRTGH